MNKLLIALLTAGMAASTVSAVLYKMALDAEMAKPLILEAGYNPQTGDVMVRERLPDGSYRGATFRKMCPRSQFN